MVSRNIQLILSYDGTEFHGWQTQPGQRTVQQVLEDVLRRVVRHPLELMASGRTDAGVHAAGQVANFRTDSALDSQKLRHAIGSRLGADISILRARDVPTGFHATHSALSKLYRYRISNTAHRTGIAQARYTCHYRKPLDLEAMREAAQHFLGTHNLRALASTRGEEKASYVRTVLGCEVYFSQGEIRIDVEGTGFLYNQVRNMVGTLIEVGRSHWPGSRIPEIIASQDRQMAGPTAPACGLCLQWVRYPPDHLIPDPSMPVTAAEQRTARPGQCDTEPRPLADQVQV